MRLAQTCLSGLQCHINLRRCYYSFEGSFVLVQRPTGGISKSARPPWELFSKIISECLETVVSAKLLVWEQPVSVSRVVRHSSQSSIATGSFLALILKADECPVNLMLFPVCLAVLRLVFFVFFKNDGILVRCVLLHGKHYTPLRIICNLISGPSAS